jgi:hypothetical protein
VLLASAATMPLLLAASGCRSSDAFDGPDPLAGRPRPGHDVVVLQAAIAAEEALVSLYVTVTSAGSASSARPAAGSELLASLLAQHRQHLARLRAALVLPPGTVTASPGATVSAGATASPGGTAGAGGHAAGRDVVTRLRAAERASAAAGVRRLGTVEPALAQLFASIAACDATHVAALAAPA